jgi:hypothetical protein
MPNRHATKKGRLNGTARKEMNMTAAHAVVDRTIVGTNEDTVFGRITKNWGNGHCQALVQSNGVRVQLHKVRIPKNRLGKKGATPITTSSVVAIFVGKDFNPGKVGAADQFDITAILDDKQVRSLMKQELIPGWFMKTADELASGVGLGPVPEEESWEWDAGESSAEESAAEDAEALAASAAIARASKGKEAAHYGDALTKKQLREIKKAVAKPMRPTAPVSVPVAEEVSDSWIDNL